MKFQILLLLLTIFITNYCQLNLQQKITGVDVPSTDDYTITANGRYLIQYDTYKITKIYDLQDGSQHDAPDNSIETMISVPNTDKILTISSISVITQYTLPNLTEEIINPSAELTYNHSYGRYFFNNDGSKLIIIYEDEIETVDFSDQNYTYSGIRTLSECDTLDFENYYFYYDHTPEVNKITYINQFNRKTCVVDYSDWDNFTVQQGSHTDDANAEFNYGSLNGDKSIVESFNDWSDAYLYSLLTGEKVFTYTLGEDGPATVQVASTGNYWVSELGSNEFIVGDSQNLCKYQKTEAIFTLTYNNDYEYFIQGDTLIILQEDDTIYAYSIGQTWQDFPVCTQSSASLDESQEELQNQQSQIITFSMISVIFLFLIL